MDILAVYVEEERLLQEFANENLVTSQDSLSSTLLALLRGVVSRIGKSGTYINNNISRYYSKVHRPPVHQKARVDETSYSSGLENHGAIHNRFY